MANIVALLTPPASGEITETDSLNTYEYKDYFVIASDFNLNNPGDFNLSKTLQLNGGKKCKRTNTLSVKL